MTSVEEEVSPLVQELRTANLTEQRVCYHEGAHTVACLEYGYSMEYIEMGTGLFGGANGSGVVKGCENASDFGTDEFVISFLVGTEAERYLATLPHYHAGYDPYGGSADMQVVEWHMRTYGDKTSSLPALRSRSYGYVVSNWPKIEAIAAVLLKRHRIREAAARAAAKGA